WRAPAGYGRGVVGDFGGRAADVARWGPQRVGHWASIGRCLDACSVGICSSVVLHRVLLEV
ncbi:MAG: hypothetical protein NXI28_26855, partial [bacterium]|nr:hypothetical protein [bacterium]